MAGPVTTIQITTEYKQRLNNLAELDNRPYSSEIEWLIDQEYARRNNPTVAVVSIVVDGEERIIPAMVTRDFKSGKVTIVPQSQPVDQMIAK